MPNRRFCIRCRRPLPDEIQPGADWEQVGPEHPGHVVCSHCLTLEEERRRERRQGSAKLGSTLWDDQIEEQLTSERQEP